MAGRNIVVSFGASSGKYLDDAWTNTWTVYTRGAVFIATANSGCPGASLFHVLRGLRTRQIDGHCTIPM